MEKSEKMVVDTTANNEFSEFFVKKACILSLLHSLGIGLDKVTVRIW